MGSTARDGEDGEKGELERLRERVAEQSATLEELERSVVQLRHTEHGQRMDAVCRLAENVAQELNEIVLTLVTHTNLALEASAASQEDEPRCEHLRRVQEASRRTADLARRMRDIGQSRIARVELVELNEIVERFVALVRRAMPRNVELDFIPGHQLASITADPSLIEQVLLNLCINARDAMPRGGRVTIETENVLINGKYRESHPWASPGRYVLLTVSDEGVGMTPQVRERAFEPFFTTKPGRGVGLGLATVYGIVQTHRGMVHVYSEVDRGSTFKIYLPAVSRRADDVGTKIDGAVHGGSETILVAEDHEEVRRLVVRLLERAGYRVLSARDGWDALEIFSENQREILEERIALVVMDVVMPNLCGLDASDRIRMLDPLAKILFASGSAGRSLGGDRALSPLLEKPYEPDRLLRTIRQILDGEEVT